MKGFRIFGLVALALAAGFLTARWSAAQAAASATEPAADYDFALRQLESFVRCLEETKQAEALRRFNDLSNAQSLSQSYADLGVTLGILQRLRAGNIDGAIDLLEGRVSMAIVTGVGNYKALPAAIRPEVSLTLLRKAKDYRGRFPAKSGTPGLDDAVADAFKILDADPDK